MVCGHSACDATKLVDARAKPWHDDEGGPQTGVNAIALLDGTGNA
jgi:hypothetical protein